ncbi:MAG: response regulator [Bacteroidota bacterium]
MKKILVVDDEEDILVVLKAFLLRNGYQVEVTQTCGEALRIFYSFLPDLVLLDINVGNSDGREVCKTIKSQAAHRHIPVILISANRNSLLTYSEYGADGAVEKPFSFDALLRIIESHL